MSRSCQQEKLYIGEHKQDRELTLGIFQRNGKKLTQATHEDIASQKQEAYQVNILICTSHFSFFFFFLQTITLLFKLTFFLAKYSFFQQNLIKAKIKSYFGKCHEVDTGSIWS